MVEQIEYIPKCGDYIEGIETTKVAGEVRETIIRGWFDCSCKDKAYIRADDQFNGNRGTQILMSTIRRVFVRVPMWWKTSTRKIKPGTVVKHFKGNIYTLIGYALALSDGLEHEVAVYQSIENPDKLFTRDAVEFNSLVDIERYPNVKQKYRFEEVETD